MKILLNLHTNSMPHEVQHPLHAIYIVSVSDIYFQRKNVLFLC